MKEDHQVENKELQEDAVSGAHLTAEGHVGPALSKDHFSFVFGRLLPALWPDGTEIVGLILYEHQAIAKFGLMGKKKSITGIRDDMQADIIHLKQECGARGT